MSGVDKNNILSYSEMAFLSQPIDLDSLDNSEMLSNREGTTIVSDNDNIDDVNNDEYHYHYHDHDH